MITDYFKLALGNLRRRKLRSILTVIGIFIAIATIFVLLSLSIGLDNAIKEQFRQLGTDKFFIQPKGQAGAPGSGGAASLSIRDAEVVEKVNGVKSIAYFNIGNVKITYNKKNRYYMVMGMPTEKSITDVILESMGLDLDEGRMFKTGDNKKTILGYNYKYGNMFDRPIGVGDKIELNDVEFTVIGIFTQVGNPQDDQQVYITFDDAKELLKSGDRVDFIYAQIKTGEDISKVVSDADRKLMRFRDVTLKTKDYTISTPQELLSSFGVVLNIITAFLLGIAFISLLVGGIGIANTMFTSVLERTKEIGTMKAIGAKNRDILYIIVIESGFLGLIGGVLGIIFGYIAGKTVEFIALNYFGTNLLKIATPWYLVLGCLLFGFLIGALSGFFPAKQASKLKPADTLRYE